MLPRARGCKQLVDLPAPMRGLIFGERGNRPLPEPHLPKKEILIPGKALICPADRLLNDFVCDVILSEAKDLL